MGKPKRIIKIIVIPLCIILIPALIWVGFSLIGRVRADVVIPASPDFRLTIHHPVRLIDGILAHESLQEIVSVPALAAAAPVIDTLKESPLLKNRFVRFAARGTIEFAVLPGQTGAMIAAWDMGIMSPLLRVFPIFSRIVNVPDLYFVQSGRGAHFEFRMDDMTLFIGPYRNLLVITNSLTEFERQTGNRSDDGAASNGAASSGGYSIIRPASFDIAFLVSPEFCRTLLGEQNDEIAAVLNHIDFDSTVEAGLTVQTKKLELHITASLSSRQAALSRLLEQRARVPNITERFPASAQYATVLSAGTLEELLQAAQVFSGPDLADTIRQADSASRTFLRLSLDDLLFSWSGNEFAVFSMEGRPHPIYAIHITDERKRQDVFERAFRSIALSENVRLNLDGTRIPQIEIPPFLQTLLRHWDIILPAPYYLIHQDYLLVSESAEVLLAAVRSMQRNEVLPRTDAWREIAGARSGAASNAANAFSLYYSLDVSIPFFLRRNTVLSSFLGVYRRGLVRMRLDRGIVDLSLSLVPGPGGGITMLSATPIETRGRPSNRIFGAGRGEHSRIFISAGDTVLSIDPNTNNIRELSGQGQLAASSGATSWIIPAEGLSRGNNVNAWVVSDRGRVTLADGDLEPAQGFPVLTGLRLSAPPVAYNGRVYLCDEDGKVHAVDSQGNIHVWLSTFFTALRSPPNFLAITARGSGTQHYAAAYPKSFFGEIWLLDHEGRAQSNWPASLIIENDDGDMSSNGAFSFDAGIGFGSPLLFAHNNRVLVAFVSQAGDLFLFDENAAGLTPFPIILEGIFFQQPVFDGEFLWLVSAEGTLFRVSLEGEVLFQSIAGFSVMEEGYITVFDSNGDREPEIFITGEGNTLHGYTRHFRSLEGFPLPMWGRPHFVEAQGNRRAEIFGMGMDGRLYRWQFR